MPTRRTGALAALVGALLLLQDPSEAAGASRSECVEAHGRGQDQRQRGQLARARETFLGCAQSACPALVQADCARFAEELVRLVPSVTFGARDPRAGDLPDTRVYVDDTLVATRLDDGRAYDLDPGRHNVRYVHGSAETTLTVVLNQGERGRLLVATFSAQGAVPPGTAESPARASAAPSRSAIPWVIAGAGAAAVAVGGVLFGVGLGRVPSNCALGARECVGPPDDPSLAQARSGVTLANTGLGVAVGGAAVVLAGLLWALAQPGHEPRRGRGLSPWLTF